MYFNDYRTSLRPYFEIELATRVTTEGTLSCFRVAVLDTKAVNVSPANRAWDCIVS